MATTQATQRLVTRIRADLALVSDQQVRDLVGAWADAWNEVAPDLNTALLELLMAGDKVTRAQLLRSARLLKVLAVIADHLETLTADARVRIIGDLRTVIERAGAAQAAVIESQLPPGQQLVEVEQWSQVDRAAVEAIVRRSTQQITSTMRPLSRSADRAVRRELVRGYAAGANPRATAARIVARAEGRFNGGLARALAIARTETLDAARAGAHLGRMQNTDVLAGWYWHCEFSVRSCQACISMEGTEFPADAPGPNDHVNGRCVAVPFTKSWADLGFDDIVEPEPVRQSGEDWFNSQPASTQRSILGPARYEAWRRGDYPMSQWGAFHRNDGWRDSLQTTPAPATHSGGRRAAS